MATSRARLRDAPWGDPWVGWQVLSPTPTPDPNTPGGGIGNGKTQSTLQSLASLSRFVALSGGCPSCSLPEREFTCSIGSVSEDALFAAAKEERAVGKVLEPRLGATALCVGLR